MRRSTGSSSQNGFSFLSHSQLVSKAKQQAAETAQWELQISPRRRQFGLDLSIADEFSSPGLLSNPRSPLSLSPSRRTMLVAADFSTSIKSNMSATSPLGRTARSEVFNTSPRSPLKESVVVTIQRPSNADADAELGAMTRFLSSPRSALNESVRSTRRAEQAIGVDAATPDTTRLLGHASPSGVQQPRPSSKERLRNELSTLSANSPSRSMEWSPSGIKTISRDPQSGIKPISRDSELPAVPRISNSGLPLLEVSREHAVQMAVEQANQKMNESSLPTELTPSRGNENFWSHLQTRELEATETSNSHDLRITRLEEELMHARAKIRSLTTEVLYLREEKSLAAEKQKTFARASHELHDPAISNTWG